MVKFDLMKEIMVMALYKGYAVQLLTILNEDQQRQNHLVDGYIRIFVNDSRFTLMIHIMKFARAGCQS